MAMNIHKENSEGGPDRELIESFLGEDPSVGNAPGTHHYLHHTTRVRFSSFTEDAGHTAFLNTNNLGLQRMRSQGKCPPEPQTSRNPAYSLPQREEPTSLTPPSENILVSRMSSPHCDPLVIETVTRICQSEIPKYQHEQYYNTIPRELFSAMCHGGLGGLSVPEEYGGLEASASTIAEVFATVSRYDIGPAIFLYHRLPIERKAEA